MARSFGEYSPEVPLGTTWEEPITLEDEAGAAVDLSDYKVRAQLREAVSLRSAGEAVDAPVLELTTVGFYGVAPDWPVFEALSVPEPTNGTILLALSVADLWTASPTNEKRRLFWSIVLVRADGYTIPVVNGKVIFLPATTL